ncbi:hypothetical protein AVEN_184797-1 [Araneus ventricosus]|uniref:Uncharacterized protein n=1 Tax=Araneus ventricosus TaxID=182803 RepID=A0A4Y2JB27_ARAVE|nr:hypothetical protein AVEN_184797-1 [Araneus ventricosus]
MQYQAENNGHTIPEIHNVLTSYQDRTQVLGFQPSAAGPPFPGQFLQEKLVSKENFDFEFECVYKEINNREKTFQIKHRGEYLCPDFPNINIPTFSYPHLANEALLPLNQRCLQ